MSVDVENEVEGYGADSIRVLEGLEAVRLRPGMYIGSTGKSGYHHLLWEVVDNSVDEAMGGFATRVDITLNPDGSTTIADDGRGIPVEAQKSGPNKGVPTVEVVFTTLHAGGKFDGKSYQFSGGLHGVGSSVVNALSEWMSVTVKRDGKYHDIEFGYVENGPNGKPVPGGVTKQLASRGRIPKSETGTEVTFLPDERIFSYSGWDFDLIARRLRQGAFLNPGIVFSLTDNRGDDPTSVEYHYPNGLLDFIDELAAERLADSDHAEQTDLLLPQEPIHFKGADEDIQGEWEMVMRWYPDQWYRVNSFANGIETGHGGTHVKGYEQVLTMLANRYARQDHIGLLGDRDPNLEAADIRSGLGVIISVKVKEPQFVGQTKDELSNDETRQMVRYGFSDQFWDWMQEHPVETRAFLSKCIDEMRLRHKLAAQAQAERDKAEKKGYAARSIPLPHKLNDCSTRDRSEAELFIVEGDSAAGPAIKGRDAKTQAILPIRGKSLNIERALAEVGGEDRIANNKEVQGLIATIGAGSQDLFDVSQMRYGKVILLADADADGFHIQLLLMTMLYRLMPELVKEGNLYIAKPPLFSLNTKKGKMYFADQAEVDEYAAKNPNADFSNLLRFKGLGEMDTYQLRETSIDPATRSLSRIVVEDDSLVDEALNILMGKQTADARWEILKDVTVDESAS